MNRTKIEWTDYTWNPVTGCNHGCPYCYARKITERFPKAFPNGFKPTFHPDRIKEPESVKKPSKIFTVSMGDFFGDGVKISWQDAVLQEIVSCSRHTYQILTKVPDQIDCTIEYPSNIWLGASVTGPQDLWRVGEIDHHNVNLRHEGIRFISFEPLLQQIPASKYLLYGIDWIIIGAQTNPLVLPPWEWIDIIVDMADRAGTAVFVKDNIVKHSNAVGYQDFPGAGMVRG